MRPLVWVLAAQKLFHRHCTVFNKQRKNGVALLSYRTLTLTQTAVCRIVTLLIVLSVYHHLDYNTVLSGR